MGRVFQIELRKEELQRVKNIRKFSAQLESYMTFFCCAKFSFDAQMLIYHIFLYISWTYQFKKSIFLLDSIFFKQQHNMWVCTLRTKVLQPTKDIWHSFPMIKKNESTWTFPIKNVVFSHFFISQMKKGKISNELSQHGIYVAVCMYVQI